MREKIEEQVFKSQFPNEEYDPDYFNDWVGGNPLNAYNALLKISEDYANQKQSIYTDEKARETIEKGFNQLYTKFYQVWKYYNAEPYKEMVLSNFKADLDILKGFINSYQPIEHQVQKLAETLNEKMIHPEKDIDLLLEELQNIGLFFNEDEPYWYFDGE